MMENSLVCHLSYNGATSELTRKAKNAHKLYQGNLIRENTKIHFLEILVELEFTSPKISSLPE